MADTLRCPLHSARIASAVAFSTSTPSGDSSTRFSRTGSHCSRAWPHNLGREAMVTSRIGRFILKRVMDGIQHAPQYIALEFKGSDSSLLLLESLAVAGYKVKSIGGITRRLRQARLEVSQASGPYPGVVALKGRDALLHQVGREEFRERGRYCLDPGSCAGECNIGIHGKAYAWHDMAFVEHLLAAQPHGFGKAQPIFDASLPFCCAVVIDDALHPDAANSSIGTVGQDRCILNWYHCLVIVAVSDPTLNLCMVQAARVHVDVKRVLMVIVFGLRSQGLHKRLACQRRISSLHLWCVFHVRSPIPCRQRRPRCRVPRRFAAVVSPRSISG